MGWATSRRRCGAALAALLLAACAPLGTAIDRRPGRAIHGMVRETHAEVAELGLVTGLASLPENPLSEFEVTRRR